MPSRWSTFPWSAVGACVALAGLIIGALKLAVMWGAAKEKNDEQDRRIALLETISDGVPKDITDQVSSRYVNLESVLGEVQKHLTKTITTLRKLEQRQIAMKARCDTIHGPPSAVTEWADAEASDTDLTLDPPTEMKDGTKG